MAVTLGRKKVHAMKHPCRCPFNAIHQIKTCMMQDMNNIEGAPASMAPAACFTACTFSTRVGRHILHHAYFSLVHSNEGAPTRMLHSVYIFSTRVGSHILHHACFFSAQPQQKNEKNPHMLCILTYVFVFVCMQNFSEQRLRGSPGRRFPGQVGRS